MTYTVKVVDILGNNSFCDRFDTEADARTAASAYRQEYVGPDFDIIIGLPDAESEYLAPT